MGLSRDTTRSIFRLLLSAFLLVAGMSHLYSPEFFIPMMPSYLPWHFELIIISGVFEILLGIGVVIPRYQKISGIGIIALLLAVFPANIHMALHPEVFPSVSQSLRWGRLPFQVLFILWAWYVSY